jgi:AraC-like DNA-binding protein
MSLPDRFRLETTDLGQARDLLTLAYGPVRISTPDKTVLIRLAGQTAGPLRLGQADLPMTLDYQCAPAGRVLIGYVAAGVLRRRTAGEAAPVRFTSMTAGSAAAARCLRATLEFAWELVAGPGAGHQPLVTGSTARLVAATVLATFPGTAAAGPDRAGLRDAGTGTLHRAVRFIDEHAGSDLSMAEIAGAASVSIRAVQLAFRRELGVTPLAYLRRVRLERAHQDLMAAGAAGLADAAGLTVTDVSARWGFSSSSRFAAYYREAFGVLPSQTLRRAG